MIARLLLIAILVILSVCLVTGIRVLAHDGWQRLAWAAVRLSRAAPRAAEAIARAGDHVAAWLALRSAKDAPAGSLRAPRSQPPAEFGPVPPPAEADPSMTPLTSELPAVRDTGRARRLRKLSTGAWQPAGADEAAPQDKRPFAPAMAVAAAMTAAPEDHQREEVRG
jgi:hypothetical protein